MKDNINPNPTNKSNSGQSWYKSTKLIVTVVIITAIAGYFGYGQMSKRFSFRNLFTKYEPLDLDSLNQKSVQIDPSMIENDFPDTLIVEQDTVTSITDNIQPQDSVFTPLAKTKPDSNINSLFKVNTSYGKIELESTSDKKVEGEIKPSHSVDDLFEELLLPNYSDKTLEASFIKYYQENIVSSKSILKLLSIVGKHILLGNNADDDKDMIGVLTESDEVIGILIVNRKGKVVYATNRKQLNTSINFILPQIDINETTLSWYQEENQDVASLPLYHTYGKIGTAILITAKK